jgi:diguanylate cyclase (GGDEF)-like protein
VQVLLAEDSRLYRELTTKLLNEWGFEVIVAEDGHQAWETLQNHETPTIVLLDWVLPEIDGLELCRRIRQASNPALYTYTILITAKGTQANLLEGMEAGADDYLIKPFDPLELKARLLVGKRILKLHSQLAETTETLRMAATYDSLTKLLNRHEILQFLHRELQRAKREGKPVSVVIADVDHFKQINDNFGHPEGDAVLVALAKQLKANLRIYDAVGRYGGEEFLMVMSACTLDDAIRRAEETRQQVSKEITAGRDRRPVTLSLGIAVATSGRTVSPDVLIKEADIALYRAKNNGRNRVEVYC